jgi:hypothetical protein
MGWFAPEHSVARYFIAMLTKPVTYHEGRGNEKIKKTLRSLLVLFLVNFALVRFIQVKLLLSKSTTKRQIRRPGSNSRRTLRAQG